MASHFIDASLNTVAIFLTPEMILQFEEIYLILVKTFLVDKSKLLHCCWVSDRYGTHQAHKHIISVASACQKCQRKRWSKLKIDFKLGNSYWIADPSVINIGIYMYLYMNVYLMLYVLANGKFMLARSKFAIICNRTVASQIGYGWMCICK